MYNITLALCAALGDAPTKQAALDAAALGKAARALFRSYAAHVRAEEEELFPAARAALSPSDLAQMTEEMAGRRGR